MPWHCALGPGGARGVLGGRAAPSMQLHQPLPKPHPNNGIVAVPDLLSGAVVHVSPPGEREKAPSPQHSVGKSTVLGAVGAQDQPFPWDKSGDPRGENLGPMVVWLPIARASGAVKHPIPLSQPCGPLLPGLDPCLPPKTCLHSQHLAGEPGRGRPLCALSTLQGLWGLGPGVQPGERGCSPLQDPSPLACPAWLRLACAWAGVFWATVPIPRRWEGTGSSPQQQPGAVAAAPHSPQGGEQPSAPSASVLQS